MASLPLGRGIKIIETLRMLWHLPTLVRLLGRLLGDGRVMGWTKALFVGALLFIVSPFDLVDFVPVLGQVSDIVLALMACRWFLGQCPSEVVAGHLSLTRWTESRLRRERSGAGNTSSPSSPPAGGTRPESQGTGFGTTRMRSVVQRAMKEAVRASGITKRATCHTAWSS